MKSLTFPLLFILVSTVAMVTQSKNYQFDVTWQVRSPDCVERATTAINGGFPGPTLRVKPGEQVVVKVVNHLSSDALTIHWHGQRQYKNVWHDGIGMISGCPIPPHTSFSYIFNANDAPGTYFYHGHLGGIRAAGLYGMLIIEPDSNKPEPWKYDDERTLLLSDWYHQIQHEIILGLLQVEFRWSGRPQSILLNGKGYFNCSKENVPVGSAFPYYKPGSTVYCNNNQCPGLEIVEVEKGKTYRLRLGNIAELSFMNIAIENHNMTVVEADGYPTTPKTVESLDINSGQRYSVLITTDQPVGSYWISVMTRHRNGVVTGQAILRYKDSNASEPSTHVSDVMASQPSWDNSSFSFNQQNSLKGTTSAPGNDKVTRRIVMVGTQERFAKGESYNNPDIGRPENNCNATGRHLRWAVNGVTYRWETTPVAHMVYYDIRPETFTEERGYFKIKSGDVIDIVIQDYPACNQVCEQHPWHLHGHKFWVIGMGRGEWNESQNQLDSLNITNAVYRDTTTVLPDAVKPFENKPQQGGCGWTVVRFVADNPGVWPCHCHITWHFVMGMQVIFIYSKEEFPEPSRDIPICGDVTPAMFAKKNKLVSSSGETKRDKIEFILLIVGWVLFGLCFIALLCLLCVKTKKGRNNKDFSLEYVAKS